MSAAKSARTKAAEAQVEALVRDMHTSLLSFSEDMRLEFCAAVEGLIDAKIELALSKAVPDAKG